MEDNVQLKEEELVGDEVVLSDIYPKTNTNSVIDDISGTNLSNTLDRIQEKINNKLSRVVNSVNGRTGVVVLDSSDVGLENVDNVSFSDIKGWVINLLVSEFANKRIALLNSLDDAEAIATENQEANRNRPFYAESGYLNLRDKRSYIGYFYYDESRKSLQIVYRPIKTVGSTDGSLLYENDIGRLSVRIKSDETALTNSIDPGDPGLYINKTALMPNVRYFDGVWGRIDEDFISDIEVMQESDKYLNEDNPKTEQKYRRDMKGFVPATGAELTNANSQMLIIRFRTESSSNVAYLGNTPGSGYYIGDGVYNDMDGKINFTVASGGTHQLHYISTLSPDYSYAAMLRLPGQGIYRDKTEVRISNTETHMEHDIAFTMVKTKIETLKPNEIIYCAFRVPLNANGVHVIDPTTNERFHPDGIDDETLRYLTNRQPAFGIVKEIPGVNPKYGVIIDFYDKEIQPGWSIEYAIPVDGNKSLELTTAKAIVSTYANGSQKEIENMSGMQIISPQGVNIDDVYGGAVDTWELLNERPSDWRNNWVDYYVKVDGNNYVTIGEHLNVAEKLERYKRQKAYTKFVVKTHPPRAEQLSEIKTWVENHSSGTMPYVTNGILEAFKKLVPYESFISNPKCYLYEWVWSVKDLSEFPEVISQIKGDVNFNGQIDSEDATIVQRAIVNNRTGGDYGLTATERWAADYNSDNEIDVTDSTLILMEAAKGELAYKDLWETTCRNLLLWTAYWVNNQDANCPAIGHNHLNKDAHTYITDAEAEELTNAPTFEIDTYYRKIVAIHERSRYVMLPSGPTRVYEEQGKRTGGIFINPDASMCVIPKRMFYQNPTRQNDQESLPEVLRNWRPALPKTRFSNTWNNIKNPERSTAEDATPESNESSRALKDPDCYVGLNIMKGLTWFPGADAYTILSSSIAPDDWATKYSTYFEKSTIRDEFVHVKGVPESDSSTTLVAPEYEADKYYRINRDGPAFKTYDKYYSYNASGLRIIGNYDDFDQDLVNYSWFGMNYGEYQARYNITSDNTHEYDLDLNTSKGIIHSGGVSVNVGKFLEIDPGRYQSKYSNWYDGGKINVRIGKGLGEETPTYDEEGHRLTGNKIQIKLGDTNSGLVFDENGALNVKPAITTISRLDFVDTYKTHYIYDPLPQYALSDVVKYADVVFELGKGLKLVTDETRAADFDTLMDKLSVVQLELYLDCTDMYIAKIKSKIAVKKNKCRTSDVELEAATSEINHVIAYHPKRDHGLPYYTMSLSQLIQWAIENNVEGVGTDSGENDVSAMTLRDFKDRVAYRYVTMDNTQSMCRVGEYRIETLSMITPYTEENTAPLDVMMKYYNLTSLEDTVYNSAMRASSEQLTRLNQILSYGTYDHDWNTNPVAYNGITFTNPVDYIIAVCTDVRTAFTKASLQTDDFSEALNTYAADHIKADSLGEMWTTIVEHLGYTSAQDWLNDSTFELTREIIKTYIEGLKKSEGTQFDYGWSKRAAEFFDRLSSTTNMVRVRELNNPTVTHKVSLSFIRKVVSDAAGSVTPTEITKSVYTVVETAPGNWSQTYGEHCIKYIPNISYNPYEANKYYREDVLAYEKLLTEPVRWSESYWKYYIISNGEYVHPEKGTVPTFTADTYYRKSKVQYTKLTSSTFTDQTYVGTGDKKTAYPPTTNDFKNTNIDWDIYYNKAISADSYMYQKYKSEVDNNKSSVSYSQWLKKNGTGENAKAYVNTASTDSSSSTAASYSVSTATDGTISVTPLYTVTPIGTYVGSTANPTIVGASTNGTTIIGYTTDGTPIYGYPTTSGGTNATTVSTSSTTTADDNWANVYAQYFVESKTPYPTLVEAGYTIEPWFVNGMFYAKQTETREETIEIITENVKLTDLVEESYEHVPVPSDSSIPEFVSGAYYEAASDVEYSAVYDKPDNWDEIDWPNNTVYYNYAHVLLTTNPGEFIPSLYYTKKEVQVYSLLTSKPLNWDTNYTDYYTRKDGSQVRIRTDVSNATWLETGNRITEAEKNLTWVVTSRENDAHAGLDGFRGEDLNTLMLYVIAQRWSLKKMVNKTAEFANSFQYNNAQEKMNNQTSAT